jgi:hypothetical protein
VNLKCGLIWSLDNGKYNYLRFLNFGKYICENPVWYQLCKMVWDTATSALSFENGSPRLITAQCYNRMDPDIVLLKHSKDRGLVHQPANEPPSSDLQLRSWSALRARWIFLSTTSVILHTVHYDLSLAFPMILLLVEYNLQSLKPFRGPWALRRLSWCFGTSKLYAEATLARFLIWVARPRLESWACGSFQRFPVCRL